MEASNRRGFLRALMRDAAKGATEASKVIGPPGLRPLLSAALPSEAPPEPAEADPELEPERVELTAARPSAREVTIDELLVMAHEEGLTERDEALRAIAVPALRLTPGLQSEAWLGGEPELPDTVDWPHWGGGLLDLIAQLDLSRVSVPGLPSSGHLLLFFDTLRAPSGRAPGAEEAGRALIVGAEEAVAPRGGEPMTVTGDLMLPRQWAKAVQSLELSLEEGAAYQRLRARLAEVQDVELEHGMGGAIAYHRLLGLPNDTAGQMPATCELVSRGRPAEEWDGEIEAASDRWRLLAQVSGTDAGRLFFWIPREDLAAGDLSTVRVIPQAF